jgi:chromosome partitioning protein
VYNFRIVIVTVASFKGGVGKTTSAMHIAAYLNEKMPTVLIDGDPNRSATAWSKRSESGLPFKVVDERQLAKAAREFDSMVIDTQARPTAEDLKELVEGCDLLIVPATPDSLSLDALMLTVNALETFGAERFRILLTIIPPKPNRDGEDARSVLSEAGLPIFQASIRRFHAFQKAALAGRLVHEVNDPNGRAGWEDYQAVGKEIKA